MKKILSALAPRDVTGMTGVALVAYGAYRIYAPAGFIVGGAMLIAIAILISRAE